MRIDVPHRQFALGRLSVETAVFFRGPRLFVNGDPAERSKGRYSVADDSGQSVAIELRHNFLDPIPKVKLGDEIVQLARSLTWYEYVWLAVPILLVFVGGGLGALVGILTVYVSARVFRSDRGAFSKYALTGPISMGALVLFAVLAIAISS